MRCARPQIAINSTALYEYLEQLLAPLADLFETQRQVAHSLLGALQLLAALPQPVHHALVALRRMHVGLQMIVQKMQIKETMREEGSVRR